MLHPDCILLEYEYSGKIVICQALICNKKLDGLATIRVVDKPVGASFMVARCRQRSVTGSLIRMDLIRPVAALLASGDPEDRPYGTPDAEKEVHPLTAHLNVTNRLSVG